MSMTLGDYCVLFMSCVCPHDCYRFANEPCAFPVRCSNWFSMLIVFCCDICIAFASNLEKWKTIH